MGVHRVVGILDGVFLVLSLSEIPGRGGSNEAGWAPRRRDMAGTLLYLASRAASFPFSCSRRPARHLAGGSPHL
jgi:hypothetical protein